MKELLQRTTAAAEDVKTRSLSVFIESKLVSLSGNLHWEMACSTVFCSDVMFALPYTFEGTKGIIHPEDLPAIKQRLFSGEYDKHIYLSFRIITTYGEIKTIDAEDVSVTERPTDLELPEDELLEKTFKEIRDRKENEQLTLHKQAAEFAEKISETGTWYHNAVTSETWYSDYVFRIHGVAPQSLNSNIFTFNPFIHPEDFFHVREAIDKCYQQKLSLNIEYRLLKNGDEVKFVQQNLQWAFNEKGQDILYGAIKDISDFKYYEQSCLNMNDELDFQHKVVMFNEHVSDAGNFQVNIATRKITFSDNYYRIFGVKRDTTPSNFNYFVNLVHPDDRAEYTAATKGVISEKAETEREFRILKKDGKERYIRQTTKLVIHSKSEIIVIGTIIDITKEKSAQKKIRQLQNGTFVKNFAFNVIEEVAGIASWLKDMRTGKEVWSDSMHAIVGMKPGTVEMRLSLLTGLVVPNDKKAFKDALKVTAEEYIDSEFRFRIVRRGEERQLKGTFKIITHNDRRFFVGTLQDITEQSLLQEKLNASVIIEEALSENIYDRLFVTDTSNNIILWNKRCETAYNLLKEQVLGRNLFDVLPNYKNENDYELLSRALDGEKVHIANKTLSFGREYHDLSLVPLKDSQYSIWGVLHVLHDVTKEYQLREQLTQRLEFIEKLLEAVVTTIVVIDRNMNIQYWNKQASTHFNLKKENVIGKNLIEIFPTFIFDPIYNDLKKAFRGEKVHLSADFNPDKESFEENYLLPLKNDVEQVTGVLWIINDLSKEFEYLQQQKKSDEIINAVNSAFIELDFDYHIRYLNAAAEAFSGKSKDDILGQVFWEAFPEIGSEGYNAVLKAGKEMVKVEVEFFSTFYNRWIFMSVTPTIEGVIIFQYDRHDIKEAQQQLVEEHKQLKETKTMLEAAVNSAPTSMSILKAVRDESDKIVNFTFSWINGTCKKAIGDVTGRKALSVFPPAIEIGLFDELVRVVEDEHLLDFTHSYVRFGNKKWVRWTAVKFEDGLFGQMEDITQRKKLKMSLKRMH